MPRGDKTGPSGAGAMSGRRMGFCVGNTVPGYHNYETNFSGGRGFAFRRGNRRSGNWGFGVRQWTEGLRYGRDLYPSEPIDKKANLQEQMENLKRQLKDLENQFKGIE